MEQDNKNSKSAADIYDILGISSETVKEENYRPQNDSPESDNHSEEKSADANLMWDHFRICMILGIIAAVLPFIIWLVSLINFSSLFKSEKVADWEDNENSYYVEEVVVEADPYENDVEEAISESSDEYDAEYSEVFVEPYFFLGTINERYPIHLCLDLSDFGGKYYYDKSGASNCMLLNITNMEQIGDSLSIEMEEYNNDGEACGVWRGILSPDGQFSGYGEFLGNTMPFSLTSCNASDTDF